MGPRLWLVSVFVCLLQPLPSAAQMGLIAWYMFNESAGSTTVTDYGPSKHHATAINSPLFNGIYMNLTASSLQYVTLPSSFGTAMSSVSSFAFTGWVRVASMGGWSPVWDMGSGSSSYMFFTLNRNTSLADSSYHMTAYEILNSGIKQRTDTFSLSIPYNTWAHIGMSYNASARNVTLLVNGQAASRRIAPTTTQTPASVSFSYAHIGRSQLYGGYLSAILRDLRFYSRALSVAQAKAIYMSGISIAAPTKGPTQAPTRPTASPTLAPTAPTMSPTRAPCSSTGFPSPYPIGTASATLNSVLAAWTSVGCDGVITFTSPGATLQLSQPYTMTGQRLVLDASGLSSGVTLLAPSRNRLFLVTGSGANLTAKAVTFQNGRLNGTLSRGGALFLTAGAHGNFESCVFQNNSADGVMSSYGGAIATVNGGSLVLRRCVLRANTASSLRDARGGALYVSSSSSPVRITASSLLDNAVQGRGAAVSLLQGAGIWASQNVLLLSATLLSRNTARAVRLTAMQSLDCAGAGLYTWSAQVAIVRCNVTSNTLDCRAVASAGLFNTTGEGAGLAATGGSLTVNSSWVQNNRVDLWDPSRGATASALGGGIYANCSGTVLLSRSTISGNVLFSNDTAAGGGFLSYSAATLVSTRVVNNRIRSRRTAQGGGVHITARSAMLVLRNLTVSNNSAMAGGVDGRLGQGGGLYLVALRLTLSNVLVGMNTVAMTASTFTSPLVQGGGVYSTGISTLRNSTIRDNVAAMAVPGGGSWVAHGGGMWHTGQLNVLSTSVLNNRALQSGSRWTNAGVWGGGIYHINGALLCARVNMTGNKAVSSSGRAYGGALCSTGTAMTITITASRFTANNATGATTTSGGALYSEIDGSTVVQDAVLRNNTATAQGSWATTVSGGGAALTGTVNKGSIRLTRVTVLGNLALLVTTNASTLASSGGGLSLATVGDGSASFVNDSTVFSNRLVTRAWSSVAASLSSLGGGILFIGHSTCTNDQIIGNGIITSRLLSTSSTDVRGGGICGFGVVSYYTNGPRHDYTSLIIRGNFITSAALALGAGLAGRSLSIAMTSCIVDGNVATGRISTSGGGMFWNAVVSITDCVFRNNSARAIGAAAAGSTGGGAYINDASIFTVTNSRFTGNSVWVSGALGTAHATGGGLHSKATKLVILRSNFSNNTAWLNSISTSGTVKGGGAFLRSTSSASTSVTVNNTRYAGDPLPTHPDVHPYARVHPDGTVYSYDVHVCRGSPPELCLEVAHHGTSCMARFEGNSVFHSAAGVGGSQGHGGGIAFYQCKAEVNQVIVANNRVFGKVSGLGGGIAFDHGGATYANTTLRDGVVTGNRVVGRSDARGGGIGILGTTRSVQIRRCVLRNNSVRTAGLSPASAGGGGIYVLGASACILRNLVVVVNTASSMASASGTAASLGGGMMLSSGGTVQLWSCNVTSNRAWAHSNATKSSGGSSGGGIDRWSGELYVNNSWVMGNSAVQTGSANVSSKARGGGLHLRHGTARLQKVRMLRNRVVSPAFAQGGAVCLSSDTTSERVQAYIGASTISSNQAIAGLGAYGGGIQYGGVSTVLLPLVLVDSFVRNNTARVQVLSGVSVVYAQGGGLQGQYGVFTLNGTQVSGNTARLSGLASALSEASGGGLCVLAGYVTTWNLAVTANTVTSTALAYGGGILLSAIGSAGAQGSLIGGAISNNRAQGATTALGGGLYCMTRTTQLGACNLRGVVLSNNSIQAVGASAAEASGGGAFLSAASSQWVDTSVSQNLAWVSGTAGANAYTRGGGLYTSTRLILSKVDFIGNRVLTSAVSASTAAFALGGAIYAVSCDLSVSAASIANNSAIQSGVAVAGTSRAGGGGFYLNSTMQVRLDNATSVLTNNRAASPYTCRGGLAYVDTSASFRLLSATVTQWTGASPGSVDINNVYRETGGTVVQPTMAPTQPTVSPTAPTALPSSQPTRRPTNLPTLMPSQSPTVAPTEPPTLVPTASTASPTVPPTLALTRAPTQLPSLLPTASPTIAPTRSPTQAPSQDPTQGPTQMPTTAPSEQPSSSPTLLPTRLPSVLPTASPTVAPTRSPTQTPSQEPTQGPTQMPTTAPSEQPSSSPTPSPTNTPTRLPTEAPSPSPTLLPTQVPTVTPSTSPTFAPTQGPSGLPTILPTAVPTATPSRGPTMSPVAAPTLWPTRTPTASPTAGPTLLPSLTPTKRPTETPSQIPTSLPTTPPSVSPTRSPSQLPTVMPTLPPTQRPTQMPTQAPTPLPVNINVLSPWYASGSLMMLNSNVDLKAAGASTEASHVYNWTTSNATVLAGSCFSAAGKYLSVPGGCLLSGRQYRFALGVDLGTSVGVTKELWVVVNNPPTPGNCTVGPEKGHALVTWFRVACYRWTDEDGHYPLTYSFAASRPERALNRLSGVIQLTASGNASSLQSRLSSGSNVTILCTVADRYEAAALYRTSRVNISAPAASQLTSLLTQTVASLQSAATVNATQFYSALLVVSEIAAASSVPTAAVTQVLDVLKTLVPESGTLTAEAALTVAETLSSLSEQLTALQATAALEVTARVANQTTRMSSALGNALLGTATTLTGRVPTTSIEQALQQISRAAAVGMVPGSPAATYSSDRAVIRIIMAGAQSSRAYTVSLLPYSSAQFEIPPAVFTRLYDRVPSGSLVLRALHWAITDADARPRLNSSTRLFADLTTLDIGFLVGNQLRTVAVKNLTSPILTSLPLKADLQASQPSTVRLARCPANGRKGVVQATCSYASGRNVTVSLTCSETAASVAYSCPVLPRCAYWNSSAQQWQYGGCTTRLSAATSSNIKCDVYHLTTFSAVADTVTTAGVISTLASYEGAGPQEATRSYGLVLAVAIMYGFLCAGLLSVRFTRNRKSYDYIRHVPRTRMFRTAASVILHRQLGQDLQLASDDTDKRSLGEITQRVIGRRLTKMEGLRAHLRRLSCCFGLALSSKNVVIPDGADGDFGNSMRSSVERLDDRQALVIGFIKLATQMMLAIITVGSSPSSLRSIVGSLVALQPSRRVLWSMFTSSMQQSGITEPLSRVLELLLFMANKETSVHKCLAEMMVERDLPLILPRSREEAGELYVPLLRLSMLQLEIIEQVVTARGNSAGQPSKRVEGNECTLDAASGGAMTEEERLAIMTMVHMRWNAAKGQLQEEYERLMSDPKLNLSRGFCQRLLSKRLYRPPQFLQNPLEVFEKEARLSRSFDNWVVQQLYYRPVLDFILRNYYKLFVANPVSSSGQERSLFSWRLFLIDATLMLYLLVVFAICLSYGINVTSAVVANAIVNLLGGVMANYLLWAPLFTLVQLLTVMYETIRNCTKAFELFENAAQEDFTSPAPPVVTLTPFAFSPEAAGLLLGDVGDSTVPTASDDVMEFDEQSVVLSASEDEVAQLPLPSRSPLSGGTQDAPATVDSDVEEWDHESWVSKAVQATNDKFLGSQAQAQRRQGGSQTSIREGPSLARPQWGSPGAPLSPNAQQGGVTDLYTRSPAKMGIRSSAAGDELAQDELPLRQGQQPPGRVLHGTGDRATDRVGSSTSKAIATTLNDSEQVETRNHGSVPGQLKQRSSTKSLSSPHGSQNSFIREEGAAQGLRSGSVAGGLGAVDNEQPTSTPVLARTPSKRVSRGPSKVRSSIEQGSTLRGSVSTVPSGDATPQGSARRQPKGERDGGNVRPLSDEELSLEYL